METEHVTDESVKMKPVDKVLSWIMTGYESLFIIYPFMADKRGDSWLTCLALLLLILIVSLPVRPIIKTWQIIARRNWIAIRRVVLIVLFVVSIGILATAADAWVIEESSKDKNSNTIVEDNKVDEDDNSESSDDNNGDESIEKNELEMLLGEVGYANFLIAAEEINLDIKGLKSPKVEEDWYAGKRYSFMYNGQKFMLYMLESNYVSSINYGDYKVYQDGMEPYDIDGFYMDLNISSQLATFAEKHVKIYLNYPDTAKFKWATTGGYARVLDYYLVSGDVQAKNAFGVKSTMQFVAEYHIEGESVTLTYLQLDGQVCYGKYVDPIADRKAAPSKISGDVSGADDASDSFVIIDEQLGEYGQKQSNDIIYYYVPAGTYKVTALNKGNVYVQNKNDADDFVTYKFDNAGDIQIIEVPEGTLVTITIYASFKFEKQ